VAIPLGVLALKRLLEQVKDDSTPFSLIPEATAVTPTPPPIIVTPATPVPTPESVTNGFVIGPAGTTIDPTVFPEKLDLFGPFVIAPPKKDACPYGLELQYDGSCKRTGLGGL